MDQMPDPNEGKAQGNSWDPPKAPRNPGGRPVYWDAERRLEAQNVFCGLLAKGHSIDKALEEASAAGMRMPTSSCLRTWLTEDDQGFQARYALAREEQAEKFASEIIEIADTEADPARARVRIDARKWVAGKLKPKVYGDRVQLEGDVGVKLSDEQLNTRLAQLLGKAGASNALSGTRETEETA